MSEAELAGGNFRDVAVILGRVEGELKQVADAHQLLDEKIDRQHAQLRQEMAEGFSLVHQGLREHSQMIKQLQQETKGLSRSVSSNSEETAGLRGEMRTLTERFEEHQKAHAT